MDTHAVPETRDGVPGYLINGEKMWNTGMHVATHDMVFARTGGKDGDARGITCFIVPTDDPGVKIEEYLWTFNMPTDHPRVSFTNVWVPETAIFESLAAASPWRSISSMKIVFARRPRALARPSSALTNP